MGSVKPDGDKVNSDDLVATMIVENKKIWLHFGEPIDSFGFDMHQAIEFAGNFSDAMEALKDEIQAE